MSVRKESLEKWVAEQYRISADTIRDGERFGIKGIRELQEVRIDLLDKLVERFGLRVEVPPEFRAVSRCSADGAGGAPSG